MKKGMRKGRWASCNLAIPQRTSADTIRGIGLSARRLAADGVLSRVDSAFFHDGEFFTRHEIEEDYPSDVIKDPLSSLP